MQSPAAEEAYLDPTVPAATAPFQLRLPIGLAPSARASPRRPRSCSRSLSDNCSSFRSTAWRARAAAS
jgi:hypothetical protein